MFCTADGNALKIRYSVKNNLPLVEHRTRSCFYEIELDDLTQDVVFLSVGDESNQNITAAQKESLLWHWKLKHLNFGWVQILLRPRTYVDEVTGKRDDVDPVLPHRHAGITLHCASTRVTRLKTR